MINLHNPVYVLIRSNIADLKLRLILQIPFARCGFIDQKKGEQAVAMVVPDGQLDITELHKHCKKSLVDYQVPTRFEIIDELPRNTMGKILKRTLRDRLIEQDSATSTD